MLTGAFYFNGHKIVFVRTPKGQVSTWAHLKQIIHLGTRISEQS